MVKLLQDRVCCRIHWNSVGATCCWLANKAVFCHHVGSLHGSNSAIAHVFFMFSHEKNTLATITLRLPLTTHLHIVTHNKAYMKTEIVYMKRLHEMVSCFVFRRLGVTLLSIQSNLEDIRGRILWRHGCDVVTHPPFWFAFRRRSGEDKSRHSGEDTSVVGWLPLVRHVVADMSLQMFGNAFTASYPHPRVRESGMLVRSREGKSKHRGEYLLFFLDESSDERMLHFLVAGFIHP